MDKQRVHTNPQHYSWLTEQLSPPSPLGAGLGRAFWIGGLICALVQILMEKTKLMPGRIMVLLVCTGAILGSLGIYEPFLEFAGAGATVPLCGFGYSLWEGIRTAINDDGFIGIFKGGFTASSIGISASILISYIASLIFDPKMKK